MGLWMWGFMDTFDSNKMKPSKSEILKRYRSFVGVSGELGWVANADGEVEEDIPSWRKFTGQTLKK
jgi:hypothetical protein